MDTSKVDKPVKWIRRDDSAEIYTNQFFMNWSTIDVRIRFGNLIPTSDTPADGTTDVCVEEQASVIMAWAQVKAFSNSLVDVVKRYEKANGVIELTKLKLPE